MDFDFKINNINVKIIETKEEGSVIVADYISKYVNDNSSVENNVVLGLATGSTPIPVYERLVENYNNQEVSFENVKTFNLDEYYPIEEDNEESYHYFMNKHLFSKININDTNIPTGKEQSEEEIENFCTNYENDIKESKIDIQILGIGRNGHIGFNEPPSERGSVTRKVELNEITRTDASDDFGGIDNVPKYAITMGISSIMDNAKEIILMAWGNKKAEIVAQAIESSVTNNVPASLLQQHTNVTFVLDREAASKLSNNNNQ
eukprot:TRINITY_DN6173_c0_g4_i1.p1 TRINITY_DN6173_c0_g4~~TRINITY_DN6173_c0_g4_i1.p1  ORF type:complete len:262 (-),score=95.20 TRINITY_DN6173_c0_g4_i1:165-950(-)